MTFVLSIFLWYCQKNVKISVYLNTFSSLSQKGCDAQIFCLRNERKGKKHIFCGLIWKLYWIKNRFIGLYVVSNNMEQHLFVKQRLHLALVRLGYFWFVVQCCSECNFPRYQPFDRKELSPEQPLYQLWDSVCFFQVPFMLAALWNMEKKKIQRSRHSL